MAGHHHVDPEAGDGRVYIAVVINLALTAAQIIGGVLSGSLALIADAVHNFSDALSLVIAFAARKIARRPANDDMTFGYGRAEIVAALINYTTLIVVGLYLIYEAVLRFYQPVEVQGMLVIVVAGFALIIDLITALLTYSLSKQSMNIRAAFLHNVADALGSIAVIIGGIVILLYDWRLIDPLITLLIAGYILWQSFSEIGAAIRILMLGSPTSIETRDVVALLNESDGVVSVHHLHFWQMQEHEIALDAHLVITEENWHRSEEIKETVKKRLRDRFGISHFTLETEHEASDCGDRQEVGHEHNTEQKHLRHCHSHDH